MDTIYSICYNFLATYIFPASDMPQSSFEIGGESVTLSEWACHSLTIVFMVVLLVLALRFVWWLVQMVAGAFNLLK